MAPVMMKLSAAPRTARPASRTATDRFGVLRKSSEHQIEQSRRSRRGEPDHHRPFGAAPVGCAAGPDPRDECCSELAARHDADHGRAETQIAAHVERQHRQRSPDHQEPDQDGAHDRRERGRHGGCGICHGDRSRHVRPQRPAGGVIADLVEHLSRNLKRGHRGGPAGIEGEMGDRADDLLARYAVFQSPLQVKRHFVDAVEGDQAGDRHQAAIARREGFVLPYIAEQHLVGDLGKMRCDVAERLAGVGWFFRHGSSLFEVKRRSASRFTLPAGIADP